MSQRSGRISGEGSLARVQDPGPLCSGMKLGVRKISRRDSLARVQGSEGNTPVFHACKAQWRQARRFIPPNHDWDVRRDSRASRKASTMSEMSAPLSLGTTKLRLFRVSDLRVR